MISILYLCARLSPAAVANDDIDGEKTKVQPHVITSENDYFDELYDDMNEDECKFCNSSSFISLIWDKHIVRTCVR